MYKHTLRAQTQIDTLRIKQSSYHDVETFAAEKAAELVESVEDMIAKCEGVLVGNGIVTKHIDQSDIYHPDSFILRVEATMESPHKDIDNITSYTSRVSTEEVVWHLPSECTLPQRLADVAD